MINIMVKKIVCLAFAIIGFNASANADGGQSEKLKWVGKGPVVETKTIEADCSDARYKISISERRGERSKLTFLERIPMPFSDDVEEKFGEVIGEFFSIEDFTLSCGSGPTDYASDQRNRPNPFKDFPDQDFTGKVRLSVVGFHSADTKKAERNCKEQHGKFEFKTWRYVTLSVDTVEIEPIVVGRCIN